MKKLAALDLGTNSTRLLCVNSGKDQITPADVSLRAMEITRLGEGIDQSGNIHEDATERVLATISDFNDMVKEAGATWVGGLATSACRRASSESVNELFDKIEERFSFRPNIVDGHREAELTFKGISISSELDTGTIIDIGGGSTEWITFEQGNLKSTESLPLGVVTLNERCISEDRYDETSFSCFNQEIQSNFEPEESGNPPLISVGGTGTTLASIVLDLDQYVPEKIHNFSLKQTDIKKQVRRMRGMKFTELSQDPMIQSGREDVILPGVLILNNAMKSISTERVLVSDFGILAGFLSEFIL